MDDEKEKHQKHLTDLRLREAEDLAQTLAGRYGLPYLDLTKTPINTDALRLVPEVEARAAGLAAYKIIGSKVFLGLISTANPKTKNILADLEHKGYQLTTSLVSETSLKRAWERYSEIHEGIKTEAGVVEIAHDVIDKYLAELKTVSAVQTALNDELSQIAGGGGSTSNLLEIILAGALATEASDVHLEPESTSVRLRYRLDGVLQDISHIDLHPYQQLLSRVKLTSGLRLNIKQTAQDGRFSIRAAGAEIEIRTAILPGPYGESIVLRVLNPKSLEITFENLGVSHDLFALFDREIHKPNGLVLLTGPTGSGKTTTLYAFLRRINSPGSKIITIEDPIEYHLAGISQTQVNVKQNYTFLSGLRSALRQDPDIIMVGEIRDKETAAVAINAALTGHLVFSTLHTNTAAGAIPRLIDLSVNPKVISSGLTLAIAQRLVRKLCDKCKKADQPTAEEKKLLTQIVASIKKVKPSEVPPQSDRVWRPVGCSSCNNTGYRGRLGLFEAIAMDERVAAISTSNPSEREIKLAAQPQGILDMRQDGILKVLASITDLGELGRVIDLYQEIV